MEVVKDKENKQEIKKRLFGLGISNFNIFNHRSIDGNNDRDKDATYRYAQFDGGHNHKYNRKRVLNSKRGQAIIEFIMVALLLVFLTYSGLESWVVMTEHQHASHLANKYLERMSLEGRLSIADENALINEFNKISLTVEQIEGPRESQGDERILRNSEDSTIILKVTAKPQNEPLWVGKLIGGNTPEGSYRIKVGGEILSERIYPE